MQYRLADREPSIPAGHACFIADNAVVLGGVELLEDTSIWFNAVLRGDQEPIVIGRGSNVQDGAVCHTDPGYPLTVGAGVTIGHQAMLHGATVGDNTLIGIRAVVLNGAVIGRDCLIGAGAVVPEGVEIPDASLVLGMPGRIKRTLSDEEIERNREGSAHYVNNFKRYLNQFEAL